MCTARYYEYYASFNGIPNRSSSSNGIDKQHFYLWHTSFGDPSVAGWITPGIPIYTAYYETFSKEVVGPTGVYIERTQALIAAQLILAVIFLVFGLTGLGTTFVEKIPTSITAGILLGSWYRIRRENLQPSSAIRKRSTSIILSLSSSCRCSYCSLNEQSRGERGTRYLPG